MAGKAMLGEAKLRRSSRCRRRTAAFGGGRHGREGFKRRVVTISCRLTIGVDNERTASRLCNPAGLRRCLIIVESFAYPDGAKGQRTRCWFGLWDNPLIVWAGLCSADGENCVGILVQANDRIEPYSETMPRLLLPEDRERWLAGEGLLSLGPTIDANAFYRENLGERWSTCRPDENEAATSLRAAG